MTSIYGFRGGPTYRPATAQDMWDQALDLPMSQGATFWDQAKGGALESFGLGTAIRSFSLPPAASTRRGRETDQEYEARQERLKAISEEDYKASPYYREGVPWDAGMTEDRAAALATMYDTKKVREYFAEKRPITSFFGNLAGQAIDPINYIPVAGPSVKAAAVARMGIVKGVAATAALDAAANTAIAGLATRETRRGFGDDVSWEMMVSEIATAALLGTAFGTVGGVLERRAGLRADAMRSQAEVKVQTLKATQEARIALNEAIGGLANDGEVRLSPNAVAPIERVVQEAQAASARPSVRSLPSSQALFLPEAPTKEVMDTFSRVEDVPVAQARGTQPKMQWDRFERGEHPGELVKGYGDMPVAVRREDGEFLIYDGHHRIALAASAGQSTVKMHVVDAKAYAPEAAGKKPSATPAKQDVSDDDLLRELGLDTSPQMADMPRGGSAVVEQVRSRPVDASPARPEAPPQGRAEAEAKVAKPENYKALADQYRVDPEAGTFPEEAELRQLAQEGRLSEDDMAVLNDADEAWQDGVSYGEALRSVVSCLV